jgi:hypothetical protein
MPTATCVAESGCGLGATHTVVSFPPVGGGLHTSACTKHCDATATIVRHATSLALRHLPPAGLTTQLPGHLSLAHQQATRKRVLLPLRRLRSPSGRIGHPLLSTHNTRRFDGARQPARPAPASGPAARALPAARTAAGARPIPAATRARSCARRPRRPPPRRSPRRPAAGRAAARPTCRWGTAACARTATGRCTPCGSGACRVARAACRPPCARRARALTGLQRPGAALQAGQGGGWQACVYAARCYRPTGCAPQPSDTREPRLLGGRPARAHGAARGRARARAPVVLDADGARAQRAAALGPARAAGPAGMRVAARRQRLLVLPRGGP